MFVNRTAQSCRKAQLLQIAQASDEWLPRIPQPWVAGMEATMFTGWVYDHLLQYSAQVKVAHPAMLKAISAGKKRMIAWMPKKYPPCCGAITFRSVTLLRARFVTQDESCDIAI